MRFDGRRSKLAVAGLALLGISSAAIALVAATATAVGLPIVPPGSCGRDSAGVPVLAEFDIPNGPAIAQVVPDLSGAIEFTDPAGPLHDGPLHVVVFRGPHHGVLVIGAPPLEGQEPRVPTDVVCIVRPDGDPWYFSSVDLDSLNLDAVVE